MPRAATEKTVSTRQLRSHASTYLQSVNKPTQTAPPADGKENVASGGKKSKALPCKNECDEGPDVTKDIHDNHEENDCHLRLPPPPPPTPTAPHILGATSAPQSFKVPPSLDDFLVQEKVKADAAFAHPEAVEHPCQFDTQQPVVFNSACSHEVDSSKLLLISAADFENIDDSDD
ncbi:hypothetical protein EIP91_007025 [Steccherinum ochraceum]|uniref:Uncharacterized protein n=1 Tax=Steccherinum ochraceum TaxID=92696 RepID=A0A4R0RQW6_9APHY|nr:hypothetical protein EIP91_007025 [Steccherinum ochraceum]